jgi:indolepyruvate ferredoxin oxidoreductase alpha subunit
MTGGQPTLTPNQTLEKMVSGLGVDSEHLKVITPLKRYRQTNSEIIKRELEHKGVSVVIARRACVQLKKDFSD